MRDVWDRIHDWLRENAPRGYGGLRPGATFKAIRQADEQLGLPLPEDFKASLRAHDGQGSDPGLIGGEGWSLSPLEQIVEHSLKWKEAHPHEAPRFPIAWLGTGDYVFLDPDGALLIQRRDRREPDSLAPSFRAWLEGFADSLENDEFAYLEEDGEIAYADEIE